MYDFPDCKYTYFSLIDKSHGHLFHLPASILTIHSHEDPTTILHAQKSAPKQTHSHPATPSRDPIMTRNPATPSCQAITSKATVTKKQTPHKSTKPKSPPTTSPAEPLPPSFLPHYQCISPALEDTSSPASHSPKTSPLAPHSLLP